MTGAGGQRTGTMRLPAWLLFLPLLAACASVREPPPPDIEPAFGPADGM